MDSREACEVFKTPTDLCSSEQTLKLILTADKSLPTFLASPHTGDVPKSKPKNTTTKLDDATAERIALAMKAEGATVYAEFVRSALVEKCRGIESRLRKEHPEEFERIYGKTQWA